MAYNLIACGGTFDHLHRGHEKFLEYALGLGKHVILGLTSDGYVRSCKSAALDSGVIESFETRIKSLQKFLFRKNAQQKVSIIAIDDIFGSTLSKDLAVDAIVVSEETKRGADTINNKRKELGLDPLEIFIVPSVKAEDGKNISSCRIRLGEIDREGKLYMNISWIKTGLILPESLRGELQRPFGEIVKEISEIRKNNVFSSVAVGDATSKAFNDNSIGQSISVIDFKVERKEKFFSFSELGFSGNEEIITVDNPPGQISSGLFLVATKIFNLSFEERVILKVTGEEDLAVLPLILSAPLGVNIYYGQPNRGMVRVIVSEKVKKKTHDLISKFRPI